MHKDRGCEDGKETKHTKAVHCIYKCMLTEYNTLAISSLGLRMIIEVETSILTKSLYVGSGANMALLKIRE